MTPHPVDLEACDELIVTYAYLPIAQARVLLAEVRAARLWKDKTEPFVKAAFEWVQADDARVLVVAPVLMAKMHDEARKAWRAIDRALASPSVPPPQECVCVSQEEIDGIGFNWTQPPCPVHPAPPVLEEKAAQEQRPHEACRPTLTADAFDHHPKAQETAALKEGGGPTPAKLLFAADREYSRLDNDMLEALLRLVGADPHDPERWPFDSTRYDHYDSSFELDRCNNDLRLSPEQRQAAWALGFARGWLNHKDGTETYYWRDGGESRKAAPPSVEPAAGHPSAALPKGEVAPGLPCVHGRRGLCPHCFLAPAPQPLEEQLPKEGSAAAPAPGDADTKAARLLLGTGCIHEPDPTTKAQCVKCLAAELARVRSEERERIAAWHDGWARECARIAEREHAAERHFNGTSCEAYQRLHEEAAATIRARAPDATGDAK